MKNLKENFREFKDRLNLIYMSEDTSNPEGTGDWTENEVINKDIERNNLSDEEKVERIINLVKSPIEFSLRDIKFIEQNKDLVRNNKDFRYYFRRIAEHYLSLSVVKDSVIPSRILYALGTSTLLKEFIPLKIKRGIKLVIDQRLKEIRDLSNKNVEGWTKGETSQIISLYKALKNENKKTGNKKINDVFKAISKKLVEKAIDLANSNKNLSTTERLLIWEIRRQMPDKFRASSEVSNLIGNSAEVNAKELLDDILSGNKNEKKNNPDLILVWEILEDLAYQNDVSVNNLDKKKLRNFILRGNATYFLEALNNISPKVLLPVHLQALNDLKSPAFKDLWEKTNEHFDAESIFIDEKDRRKKEKNKEYAQKEEELNAKKEKIKEKLIDEYLDSPEIKNREKVEEYKRKKDEFEKKLKEEKIGDKNLIEIAKNIKNIFSKTAARQKVFDDYFKGSIDTLIYEESTPTERFKALNTFQNELLNMRKKGFKNLFPRENSNEDNQENNNALKDEEISTLEGVFSTLKKSTLIKELEKLNEEIIKIDQELHKELLYDDESELAKLDKEIKDLETKKIDENIAEIQKEKIYDVYKDILGTREKIFNEYDAGLKQRISSHTLHASDFQVLLLDNDLRPKGATVEHLKLYEFRDKFKETLDSIDLDLNGIETVISNIDLDDPDPNLDELQPFLQKIEENIGISVFRKEMQDDLNILLDSPQIKDEVLKGLMGHFSAEITNKISDAMGSFAQDDEKYQAQRNFFINQVRTHNNISSKADIAAIDNAYQQYFYNKTSLDKKTETERNLLEGALEGVPENEKEKIREAYDKGVSFLQKGYNSDNFQFPGSQKLNEANIQAQSFSLEFSAFLREHQNNLSDLLSNISKEDVDKKDLELSFRNFKESWNIEGKQELADKISKFRNLCQEVIFNEIDENGNSLYKEFLEEYFKTIDVAISNLQAGIDELDSTISFTGKEQVWGKIQMDFKKLASWISFDQGQLSKYKVNIENRLFSHKEKNNKNENINVNGFSESVQHLKSLGIFDNRENAQEKFDEMRMDFNEKSNNFSQKTNKIRRKIESDKNKLSDEKFEEKYGMYKNEADTTMSHFNDYKKDFDDEWKHYNDPKYFEKWWEKYEKDGESRFNAISEFQNFERLNRTVDEMSNKAKDLNNWLNNWDKFGEIERQNKWYNRIETNSFSLYSIYLLIKQNMDIVDTRWKREQDRMAYNVGMQIYGDSDWGKEFRRMAEDSENERVKQWEGNYSSLEVWNVAEYLYKTNDPDEAKACIGLLNEKGYLKWDNPRLWRTLMRLQSIVVFNIPEDMHMEPEEITRKVGDACEIIWTKDDFKNWDTAMDDSMKKAKGSYEKEFRNLTDSRDANNESMLAHSLASMLEKWKKGDTTDVYPDKFYSFLHLAFEQGKLNGQPDMRWYFLIKGVTTKNPQGESLLPKTVFNKFNVDLLANMPYFDFFIDKSGWKKNGRIVPPHTPGAEQRIWNYNDFMAWDKMMGNAGGTFFPKSGSSLSSDIEIFFYDIVDMSEDARGRVVRMARGANTNLDHDDGETIFTGFEYKQIMQLLSSRSEGNQQITDDFWRNYLHGFELFMKNKKRYIEENDKIYGDFSEWQNMRKDKLRDVGEKIKIASAVIQILSGNMKSQTQKPLIFNERDWTTDKGLSPHKANNSKRTINNVLFQLLENVGDDEVGKHKERLSKNLYKKSTDYDTLKARKEWGWDKVNDANQEFFGEEGGSKYFANTEAVWNVLKNFGENGNALSMAA